MHVALLLTILAVLVSTTNAFSSTKSPRFSRSVTSFATTIQKPVTSEISPVQLRALELFDQNGAKKEVDYLMGDGKSVVIFLRHLGWPYCWAYAEEWCAVIPQMRAANVAGPIFISIGEGIIQHTVVFFYTVHRYNNITIPLILSGTQHEPDEQDVLNASH